MFFVSKIKSLCESANTNPNRRETETNKKSENLKATLYGKATGTGKQKRYAR